MDELLSKKINYLDYNYPINKKEIIKFINGYKDIENFGTIDEFLTILTLLNDTQCPYIKSIMAMTYSQIRVIINYFSNKKYDYNSNAHYLLKIKDDIDNLLNILKQIK